MLSRHEQLAIIEAAKADVVRYIESQGYIDTWAKQDLKTLVLKIEFKLKHHITRFAGKFRFSLGSTPESPRCRIDIMPYNCGHTTEQFRDTVIHELAHALVYWIYGPYAERNHHGPKWVRTMQALGVENPSRMCTGPVDPRRFVAVRCGCTGLPPEQMRIGYTYAAKIRRGVATYRCARCGERVHLMPGND